MYTYEEFRQTKINNSILTRIEHIVDALQKLLVMPCAIVGLHEKFQHAVSGVEALIRDVTPRCILTWSGLNLDSQALTSFNQSVNIMSTDPETGEVANHVIPYRRLPLNVQFKVDVVMDNVADAMRVSEYLTMLAMQVPVIPGDEHTKTTLIFDDNWQIDVSQSDKSDIVISSSLTANCQVLIPKSCAINDFEYKLTGVGVLLPDGTWDTTPVGEPILDKDGNPVLDENGEPMIGDWYENGWYRLKHNIHIHPHRITDKHVEGDTTDITIGPGVDSMKQ